MKNKLFLLLISIVILVSCQTNYGQLSTSELDNLFIGADSSQAITIISDMRAYLSSEDTSYDERRKINQYLNSETFSSFSLNLVWDEYNIDKLSYGEEKAVEVALGKLAQLDVNSQVRETFCLKAIKDANDETSLEEVISAMEINQTIFNAIYEKIESSDIKINEASSIVSTLSANNKIDTFVGTIAMETIDSVSTSQEAKTYFTASSNLFLFSEPERMKVERILYDKLSAQYENEVYSCLTSEAVTRLIEQNDWLLNVDSTYNNELNNLNGILLILKSNVPLQEKIRSIADKELPDRVINIVISEANENRGSLINDKLLLSDISGTQLYPVLSEWYWNTFTAEIKNISTPEEGEALIVKFSMLEEQYAEEMRDLVNNQYWESFNSLVSTISTPEEGSDLLKKFNIIEQQYGTRMVSALDFQYRTLLTEKFSNVSTIDEIEEISAPFSDFISQNPNSLTEKAIASQIALINARAEENEAYTRLIAKTEINPVESGNKEIIDEANAYLTKFSNSALGYNPSNFATINEIKNSYEIAYERIRWVKSREYSDLIAAISPEVLNRELYYGHNGSVSSPVGMTLRQLLSFRDYSEYPMFLTTNHHWLWGDETGLELEIKITDARSITFTFDYSTLNKEDILVIESVGDTLSSYEDGETIKRYVEAFLAGSLDDEWKFTTEDASNLLGSLLLLGLLGM